MAIKPNPYIPNVRARQRKRTLEELVRFIEKMIERYMSKNPKDIWVYKQDVADLFSDTYGNRPQKILEDYLPFLIRRGYLVQNEDKITLPKYAKEVK